MIELGFHRTSKRLGYRKGDFIGNNKGKIEDLRKRTPLGQLYI
jgi:hypothetical protein